MRLIKCCKLRTPKPFCAPDNTITKLGKLPPPVRKAQRSILHDIGLGTPRLNQSKNHANSAVKRHFWAQNLSRGSAPHPARASALDPLHETPPRTHTLVAPEAPCRGRVLSAAGRWKKVQTDFYATFRGPPSVGQHPPGGGKKVQTDFYATVSQLAKWL